MFLVMYDIQSDKLRTKFSKFLERYGRRLQCSVFEIVNSQRILHHIQIEIESNFEKKFIQGDSVLIYNVGDDACIKRFGYPLNEETTLVIL